jgi:hypothetical protein
MKVTTSAVIDGKRTNRIKVQRKARSAGTAMARYRQDPSVRGMDTVVTCISLPVCELTDLDAACERAQMARSHFIRQAVKRFIAFTSGKPE